LARKGYRVLLVDRATFPSDTVSTLCIQPPGVQKLRQWGLLEQVTATGCPPIETMLFDFGLFDFGPVVISGTPGLPESPVAYAPRRTVLDKLLVDAAAAAGVEIREGFNVEDVVAEDGVIVGVRGHAVGGSTVTERARVVIGADGLNSTVAKAVQPETYAEKPKLLCGYYAYWSGLPTNGTFETYIRPNRGFAAIPTNDDLTLVIGGWPYAEFAANKADLRGSYLKTIALAPELADRLEGATQESRIVGSAVPNFFRQPYGPGWALVGDAGYNRDFITAQGISDAFRDADLCATAVDTWLSGKGRPDEAMSGYQQTRDAKVMPMYELTAQAASLEPPPPEMQQLLGAIAGNQAAMDGFVQVNSGSRPPADFFSPDNINQIFAAAQARA
jgi:2-polyprenyl-6-methoxyphenol hydroxylase-like FAD-dependent oxidoreductase